MFRWLIVCALLCGGAFYLVSLAVKGVQPTQSYIDNTRDSGSPGNPLTKAGPTTSGETYNDADLPTIRMNPLLVHKNGIKPTFIQDARILLPQKQEVGSKEDGQIVFFGTELKEGEEKTLSPERLISQMFVYLAVEVAYDPSKPALAYPLAGTPLEVAPFMVPLYVKDPVKLTDATNYFSIDRASGKVYTRWKEGMPLYATHVKIVEEVRKFRRLEEQDRVKKGDLLALINPEQAIIDLRTKHSKLEYSEADRLASEKTRDEAVKRLQIMQAQAAKVVGSVQAEELRATELNVDRYTQEERQKRAAVRVSEFDVVAAMKVVTFHEVRAAIPGVVKAINKNRGDVIKANQDVLLQLANPAVLRAEALAEVQDVEKLHKGDSVELEVSLRVTPKMVLGGAHQQINAVAVSNGDGSEGKPRLIIAASEDKTLRAWDSQSGQEAWKPMRMRDAVRALACTPKGSALNMLLVGSSNGSACLYDLAKPDPAPIALAERHKGPITAVAFSPDGKTCATAGDDRTIIIWSYKDEEKKWELQQVLQDAHRAAITSLAYTVLPPTKEQPAAPNLRLISAGRDNAIIVWKAEPGKPLVKEPEYSHRSGDVTQIGADGKRILFDSDKELRVVSITDRQIEGKLKNASASASFSTMALFSPDGRIILTNGGSEGRPQLWRAPPKDSAKDPLAAGRGSELRQLASKSPATCGAFAPDGEFAVTGTQDGQVLVWQMPHPDEVEKRVPATISLVDPFIDTAFQVRVWAEVKDPPSWIAPGSTATIVVVPEGLEKK